MRQLSSVQCRHRPTSQIYRIHCSVQIVELSLIHLFKTEQILAKSLRLSVCVSFVHLSTPTDGLLLWDGRQTFGSLPWQCDLVLATATSRHSPTLWMFTTKQCMQRASYTVRRANSTCEDLSYNLYFYSARKR